MACTVPVYRLSFFDEKGFTILHVCYSPRKKFLSRKLTTFPFGESRSRPLPLIGTSSCVGEPLAYPPSFLSTSLRSSERSYDLVSNLQPPPEGTPSLPFLHVIFLFGLHFLKLNHSVHGQTLPASVINPDSTPSSQNRDTKNMTPAFAPTHVLSFTKSLRATLKEALSLCDSPMTPLSPFFALRASV